MSTYTIHQPPLRKGGTATDPMRFRFVREGFSFWAFLLGPIWMVRHRLFLVLLLYIVLMAGVGFALWIFRSPSSIGFLVHVLIAVLLGMEAASLRRWTLARRGWKTLGVVTGDDLESAERRFFDTWTDNALPMPASVSASPPVRRSPMPQNRDVIGLFPEPGAPR